MRCPVGNYLEALGDRFYPCASGWVDFEQACAKSCTLEEALKSEEFQKFKESIEDGSYRYCLGTCPAMVTAKDRGDKELEPSYCTFTAENLNVGIDGSCLLACKACRGGNRYIEPYEVVQKRLERIVEGGMKSYVKSITLSSCGDPIFSKSIREWLQGFKKEDYPLLKTIKLRTNAQLFSEKFWNSLGDAKDLIRSLWISIDAATKETYESLRLFSSWKRLWDNLNFIGTVKSIEAVTFSFVVQRGNVREIKQYYDLMNEWGKKYGKRVHFYFQQAGHWPGVSDRMFNEEIDIFNDPKLWREATNQIHLCKKNVVTDVPDFYLNYRGPVECKGKSIV